MRFVMVDTGNYTEAILSRPLVFDAIRAVHQTTPVLILGGHTHIRICRKHRERAHCSLYVSDVVMH
jgi:hypothetical protein